MEKVATLGTEFDSTKTNPNNSPHMRYLYTFLAIGCSLAASAQLEVAIGYNYSNPVGLMSANIRAVHHAQSHMAWRFANVPLAVVLELGVGNYGVSETKQYYAFPNNTEMLAPVRVSNNVGNAGLALRYEMLRDATLTPFAIARGGMSRFSTTLVIEDPRTAHTAECPLPLESERLVADVSWTSGLGAGLRYDMSHLFKGLGKGYYFIDFSANYTKGSIVNYMSVKPPGDGINYRDGEGVESVTMRFASEANPEIVHEYHTGYLYRTPLEWMDYRVSFVARF